ncbi:MAG TPA: cupredoxin domain-containing protein [Casimicrobiaceae bacterium]|nr:cupredoxin domain-containing protein [Casimicrobiaceae bacterium]
MPADAKLRSPLWGMQGVASVVSPLLMLAALSPSEIAHAQEAMPVFSIKALGGILEPALIEVPAGTRFKIEIENEGSDPVEFESTELHVEKVLAGGAKSYVVINALKPGTYTFFDDFHPDTGKVRVVVK